MSDLRKELHEPNLDGMTPRQANAYLLCLCQDAEDEITRLRNEAEALREDADRYRWLRAEWFKENDSWLMSHECAFLDTPEEMDAAIDAARKLIPTNSQED